MTAFTLMPAGVTLDLPVGTTVLQAVLTAGGRFADQCGGARCGACHVFVTQGRKAVSRPTPVENQRLDAIVGVGSGSRLACQASLLGTEPVTVTLPDALSG